MGTWCFQKVQGIPDDSCVIGGILSMVPSESGSSQDFFFQLFFLLADWYSLVLVPLRVHVTSSHTWQLSIHVEATNLLSSSILNGQSTKRPSCIRRKRPVFPRISSHRHPIQVPKEAQMEAFQPAPAGMAKVRRGMI